MPVDTDTVDTGLGFVLKYGDTDNAITTTVDGVLSITTPEADTAVATVAPLDSPTARKINKAGSVQEGMLEVEIVHVDAQYTALKNITRDEKWFECTLPEGMTITFLGFIAKGPTATATADDIIKDKISIQIVETVAIA